MDYTPLFTFAKVIIKIGKNYNRETESCTACGVPSCTDLANEGMQGTITPYYRSKDGQLIIAKNVWTHNPELVFVKNSEKQ